LIKAIMAPHAGYVASGKIAAYAYAELSKVIKPDAYIIIGPDHYGIPYDFVLCSDPFLTPLGECATHDIICSRLRESMSDDARFHMREHSIEVQVPFIQYIDSKAKIVPIIMGRQDIHTAERLSRILREACRGFDVVFIASSDLMHYVPAEMEKGLDAKYLEYVSACDIDNMYRIIADHNMSICGNGPTATVIMASKSSKGELLEHMNSWDTLGFDERSVVGYAAVTFYEGN
jgi:AmmeMemoRadiSam system protein B